MNTHPLRIRPPRPRTTRPLDPQASDSPSFESLHRRHAQSVVRFFLRRTQGQSDLADDLASQTWLEVLVALRERRYDPNRSLFHSYLYGVACKVLFGHLRRSHREPPHASREQIDRCDRSEESPCSRLDRHETREAMRTFMGGDDSPLREVERQIVRRVADGESEREIARSLSMAPSTIHRRKRIAFRKIETYLRRRGIV